MKYAPVFIVGAQRSGSTFLAERLGRFDAFMTTPEAQVIKRILRLGASPLEKARAAEVVAMVRSDFRYWTLGIDVSSVAMQRRLMESGGSGLAELLLDAYAEKSGKIGATHWIEHSPETILDLPWLLEMLPEAKAIHVVRDGRGVLASFRKLQWGPHSARRVADYWSSTTMAAEVMGFTQPNRVRTLRYEDLLCDEKAQITMLADWISHSSGTLRAETSFDLPKFTRKQHSLVGGEVELARLTAWRNELSARDLETFEHFARPSMVHYGYIDGQVPEVFHYRATAAARDYFQDGWKLFRSKIVVGHREQRFVKMKSKKGL